MMSSREVVRRAVRFEGPERLPRSLPETYGSDFSWVGMSPSPDWRPGSGVDEWGAIWENIGISNMGQVKEFPIKTWRDFDRLRVPDIKEPRRWETLSGARDRAGDKFVRRFTVADGWPKVRHKAFTPFRRRRAANKKGEER